MLIGCVQVAWVYLLVSTWLQFVVADADFIDVRLKLEKDRSGKRGDPKDKYFHESTFHPHYDGRFAAKEVGKEVRLDHLTTLVKTFLSTMADIGAETWIMHGTLLGWWWNQKILPWDSDLDLQVDEETIAFLAKYYNMTEYHFALPGLSSGRSYLLEINPHYTIRGPEDRLNVIDGRWIDTETGLFIDISTVRKNLTAAAEGIDGALMCKDKHHYMAGDIYPLRDGIFEGIPVKIPYEYTLLLEEEYGKKSLVVTTFQNHKFNTTSKVWVPLPPQFHQQKKKPKPPPPRKGFKKSPARGKD